MEQQIDVSLFLSSSLSKINKLKKYLEQRKKTFSKKAK